MPRVRLIGEPTGRNGDGQAQQRRRTRQADVRSLFSQQYCRVSQGIAGGRLQGGAVPPVFLVVVRDFQLVVPQSPIIPFMRAPAAAVEILRPRRQYLGACTALRIGGQLWVFDFTGVYNAERRIGFLGQLLSFGSLRESVRRGREINDRFVAALLHSGAGAELDPDARTVSA